MGVRAGANREIDERKGDGGSDRERGGVRVAFRVRALEV
jgi:hypothetical protein